MESCPQPSEAPTQTLHQGPACLCPCSTSGHPRPLWLLLPHAHTHAQHAPACTHTHTRTPVRPQHLWTCCCPLCSLCGFQGSLCACPGLPATACGRPPFWALLPCTPLRRSGSRLTSFTDSTGEDSWQESQNLKSLRPDKSLLFCLPQGSTVRGP